MSFFEYIFGGNKGEKKPEDAINDILDDLEKLNVADESSVDADSASIVSQDVQPEGKDNLELDGIFVENPVDNSGKGSAGDSDPINQLIENEPISEDYEMSDLLGEFGIDESSADNSQGDDWEELVDSLGDMNKDQSNTSNNDPLSGLFEEPKREQNLSIDKIVKTSDKIKELTQNGNFTTALSVIDQLPINYKKDALYATVALAITQELGKESYTSQSKELLSEMLTKVKKLSSYLEQTKSEDEKNV